VFFTILLILSDAIFAPKDIDLENGEIDDSEREVEAFKRFCFNSVPVTQKAKVNINLKNFALKQNDKNQELSS